MNFFIIGEKGWAYTLITSNDVEMAGHLVQNLESVNQPVPEALMKLAMKSLWFRNARENEHGGAKVRQRLGLGYKPKVKTGILF